MRVLARAGDGLLFWVSEKEMTPYSDYLAVGLAGGRAQLGYNLGGNGDTLLVCNRSLVDDGRWHTIRVHRSSLFFTARLKPNSITLSSSLTARRPASESARELVL